MENILPQEKIHHRQ